MFRIPIQFVQIDVGKPLASQVPERQAAAILTEAPDDFMADVQNLAIINATRKQFHQNFVIDVGKIFLHIQLTDPDLGMSIEPIDRPESIGSCRCYSFPALCSIGVTIKVRTVLSSQILGYDAMNDFVAYGRHIYVALFGVAHDKMMVRTMKIIALVQIMIQ